MRNTTFIYALCCPISGEIRYIGKSNNPQKRYSKHKSKTSKDNNKSKKEWFNNLISNGLSPKILILEEVDINNWKEKEKFYIKKYKELNYNLFNLNGGANGLTFGNQTSFKKGENTIKVVCLSKEGKYIKTFNSEKDGAYFIGQKSLHSVLSGKTKTAGGYIWIKEENYNSLSSKELEELINNANTNKGINNGLKTRFKSGISSWNKGINRKLKPDKNIYQYSIDNTFIKKWDNAKLASISITGSEKGGDFIGDCARGYKKTAYGFIWHYNLIN